MAGRPEGAYRRRNLEDHVAESLDLVEEFHNEHRRQSTKLQRQIDAATSRLGRPSSLIAAVAIILAWAGIAALAGEGRSDSAPFVWLELGATLAALLIALVILVTQRHADELAERRAQLMLELELLADRKSAKIISLLEELRRDHPGISNRADPESAAMQVPTDPRDVAQALDAQKHDD